MDKQSVINLLSAIACIFIIGIVLALVIIKQNNVEVELKHVSVFMN